MAKRPTVAPEVYVTRIGVLRWSVVAVWPGPVEPHHGVRMAQVHSQRANPRALTRRRATRAGIRQLVGDPSVPLHVALELSARLHPTH